MDGIATFLETKENRIILWLAMGYAIFFIFESVKY